MKTFITRERVAFFETDASGIMYFGAASRYFEIGEREALRGIGVKVGDSMRGGQELPRVHVTTDYHKPLFYDDEIEIHTECTSIRNSSLIWNFKIYRGEELCISGEMTVCAIDSEFRRPIRIPDSWREYLLGNSTETEVTSCN